MPRTGTLQTWHEDRGFGFIAPTHGGREVFVHISAFPRDGSRPSVGELLWFEVGPGKDGKQQATRVSRQRPRHPSDYPSELRLSPRVTRVAVLVVVILCAFGYAKYYVSAPADAGTQSSPQTSTQYHCDGRTRCSEMTSCAEAKFFLANCPGATMDGDNDGIPCEQQFCSNGFAR